jgi:TonB family protein
MTSEKIPTSVVVSLGLHGAALVAFGLMMREAPKQAATVVGSVELLTQAPKPRALPRAPGAPKPPPISTFDFLKLALPTPTRAAAPAQVALALPEHKTALAEAPKLQDAVRKDLPKLAALDLGNRPVDAAKLDVKVDARKAAATLAALPRLEEVGQRRIKNLPQAIALEESRREAVAAQGLPDLSIKAPSRRQALAAVAALQEAAPAASAPDKGFGSLLPEKPLLMEARPQPTIAAPKLEKIAAPKPVHHEAAAVQTAGVEQKKGVQIEGPLADRRVAAYTVPPFPDWAKDQGILEADVAIRFTVDEDGNVLPGMRVESSSSYGRIDKLAMEALKNWRFAPNPGAGVQWGVITFRFVLE